MTEFEQKMEQIIAKIDNGLIKNRLGNAIFGEMMLVNTFDKFANTITRINLKVKQLLNEEVRDYTTDLTEFTDTLLELKTDLEKGIVTLEENCELHTIPIETPLDFLDRGINGIYPLLESIEDNEGNVKQTITQIYGRANSLPEYITQIQNEIVKVAETLISSDDKEGNTMIASKLKEVEEALKELKAIIDYTQEGIDEGAYTNDEDIFRSIANDLDSPVTSLGQAVFGLKGILLRNKTQTDLEVMGKIDNMKYICEQMCNGLIIDYDDEEMTEEMSERLRYEEFDRIWNDIVGDYEILEKDLLFLKNNLS